MNDTFLYYDWYEEAYGDREASGVGEEGRVGFILENIPSIGARILDIGCLNGVLTAQFVKNGNSVEAIAMSQGEVDKAHKRGIDARKGDFLEADIAENRYDVVVAGEVIEHCFRTTAFLNKAADVLKPGGRLILTTPNAVSLPRRLMALLGMNPILEYCEDEGNAGHLRYYTFKDIIDQLGRVGFKVVKAVSDEVNFSADGRWKSTWLARMVRGFGRSIMIVAEI